MFIIGVNGENKPLRELNNEFGVKQCGDPTLQQKYQTRTDRIPNHVSIVTQP